jgi:MFS family permease
LGLLLASLSLSATGLVLPPESPPLSAIGGVAVGGLGAASALVAVGATRAAFGLFSAAAMPAVSALSSEVVPRGRKASATALIYAAFNIGE